MTKQRLIQSIKIHFLKGKKRQEYMKQVFGGYGDNVSYFPRILTLYPELIKFGNNIVVASGVNFITHDAIHLVLNRYLEKIGGTKVFNERIGCIEIGDNVFIGANATIMYNTRIASNVVIGSGALVLGDIHEEGVYVGTPAKRIASFESFMEKRKASEGMMVVQSQRLSSDEARECWDSFYEQRRD